MSIYPKRAALPYPRRNWVGADRPQPFSTRFASVSVYRFCVTTVLGGPWMQAWKAREWYWLVSARQRRLKKDRCRRRI